MQQPEIDRLADVVTRAIETTTMPLLSRIVSLERQIKMLEQRAAVPGPPGPPGERGTDGAAGRDGTAGRDGKDGINGRDGIPGVKGDKGDPADRGPEGAPGAPGAIGPIGPIGPRGEQGERGSDGPAGRDGINGKDGRDGVDGKSVTVEDLRGLVAELVTKAIGALPVPKDGKDGLPGRDGRDGLPGHAGEKGLDGKPGADGKDGHDGKDGAPGHDGTLDDLEVIQGEDLRTFTFRSKATGRTLGLATLPAMLYRDVYESGHSYAAGDVVTHQGSMWHATEATSEVPGEGATAWRLCVKRGRDGKPGAQGPEGKAGRDLTQMDFHGTKFR